MDCRRREKFVNFSLAFPERRRMDARSGSLFHVNLLGNFTIAGGDGRELTPSGKKLRALIACLALPPGAVWPRDKLIALLWGDRGDEQARASLRQALAELRRILGSAEPLVTEADTVRLDAALISVDAVDFERAAKAGDLTKAASLYRGSLLDGLHLREDSFADWLRIERTRLQDMALGALSRLAESQRGKAAIATAQQLLAIDTAREETHRLLMRLYAETGQRAQALRQYQVCREALSRELGVAPDAETDALHRQVQAEDYRPPARPIAGGVPERPAWDSGRLTIAVLPFANLSDDPSQQYFSDGISEDIITELSRFRVLSVLARDSSFHYRDRQTEVKQVGRDLGIRYVVTGSVRRRGDRIRITAQLIEAETGSQLWAERFDCGQQEVFHIEDQLVRTIVATVAGRLQAIGAEMARRKPPSSLAAYECMLRAQALTVGDPEAEAEMRRLYAQAIELDPGYGRPHALLAYALLREWFRDMSGSNALLDHALDLATLAVRLDENDSDCQDTLGWVQLHLRAFDLAEEYHRRALELNPNNPDEMTSMGALCAYLGRPEEALQWFARSRQADPYHDPTWYWHLLAVAHFVARDPAEAIAAFSRSGSKPPWVHAYLAACHAQRGDMDEAAQAVAKLMSLLPEFSIARFTDKEPYKRNSDRKRLRDALRKAGLRE
jgi:TolB-like protein/DNA-binding SARP family transcriptional activator/tetratricopeptide (TPR) repeat protein